MKESPFIISNFVSASKPVNHQGVSFNIEKRHSSALIFPIQGRLKFSWGTEEVIADPEHPILIYEGMSYTNTCLEDAQSLMINIKLQDNEEKIIRLLQADKVHLQRLYDEITVLRVNPTAKKQSRIFEKLYQLLGECLPGEEGDRTSLLSPALEVIERSYHKNDLTLDDLAESCNISKSYLHKLFKKEFGMTPFQYVTRTRMKQARVLLMEMLPVGEVSSMVGYSDIYQFSRAFKRYYKVSPDKIKKQI